MKHFEEPQVGTVAEAKGDEAPGDPNREPLSELFKGVIPEAPVGPEVGPQAWCQA